MKFHYALSIIIFVAALAGCKQDLNLAAPYKEETVVYALLNQQDKYPAYHYVRIEKGYLLNGNAFVAAGVSDSIYYPDILNVQLKAYPSGVVYNLTRVDGNTLNPPLPKDSGAFANTPNYLYTFKDADAAHPLSPNQTYTLQITNTTNGKVVTAQTGLVYPFSIYTPVYGQPINLSNSSPFVIRWATAQNAGVYDLTVRFFYKEYATSDNTLLKDTFIDMPAFRSLISSYSSSSTFGQNFLEQSLMNFLSNNLAKSPSVYREFNFKKGMQFKFSAGGLDLASFLSSQQAQNTGITSSDALPPYTNINGGVGLFSSRYYEEVDSVLLSSPGLDSLACGSFSGGLRFKNSSGNICD